MKKLLYILVCCVLVACGGGKTSKSIFAEPEPVRYEYGIPVDSFLVDSGVIQSGTTMGGLMNRLGANAQTLRAITLLDRKVFDVRSIQPKKHYEALYSLIPATDSTAADTTLAYFIYHKNIIETVVFDVRDVLHVSNHEKEVISVRRESEVTIETSLWDACYSADANPQLALELSDIYAWTVDFFALKKGDRFHVYYDEKRVDSTFVGIGQVHAASYISGGDTLLAYHYENGKTDGYFDEQGKNLKKTFLKAPLNYRRISSGFTYARKHPIYKTVRPHTGVDYAAPRGTPVVALGDGEVTFKAYKGGGGNTVKIRHNSTYTTGYLHLHGYAKGLRVGKRVKQGEVIGYVGSTGASTGPHLDFRVWKNGSPINPLKLKSPSADPVPESQMADFQTTIAQFPL